MTKAETDLRAALDAVFNERAAMRPSAKYWYPLSKVSYGTEEIYAVSDALCSTETTMGRRVAEFEDRFAQLHGGGHAVMVNSGSSADLIAALLLVDPAKRKLQPGDEVLAPAVTWPTQIDSLLMAGLSVTLVDVDVDTLSMNLDDLESKITTKTKALSVVHLMGNPCDMDRLLEICRRYDLLLLEDACEALGAEWNGKAVGTFGLAGTFSFFFSHHITTMEGGMVLTTDDEIAESLRLFRAHGWSRNLRNRPPVEDSDVDTRYEFVNWGLNVRPTEASGAFGLVQLEKLSHFQSQRAHNARLFSELIEPLQDQITLMHVPEKATCSWFALPLQLTATARVDRRTFTERLESAGIETRPVVAGNLARQPMMKLFPQIQAGELPGANAVHENGLYIGLHPFAADSDLERLAAAIRNALTT